MGNVCGGGPRKQNDVLEMDGGHPSTPKGNHLIENLKLGRRKDVRRLNEDYDVSTEKPLGVGLHGPVFKAVHRQTNCDYAKKFLCTEGVSLESLERLRNELSIMAAMDHPNIVKLVDVYDDESGFHMIEELCTGGELLDQIGRRQFPEAASMRHIKVMLDVVRYIHDKKIVHNDLKLENWLFEDKAENAQLKLIDFGFSKHLVSEDERLQGAHGSTMYMAPEMFSSKYNEQCDMWSLGVIAFMICTGQAPFLVLTDEGRVDDEKTIRLIRKGTYTLPDNARSNLSKECVDFIEKLLVVDPNQRMTAAQAQGHSWFKQLKGSGRIHESVRQSLTAFSKKTTLQRTVLQAVALSLQPQQIGTLREEFLKMDEQKNGEVSFEEFECK